MGFNIYFAGSRQQNDEHILKRKANRLYSYANDQKHIEKFLQDEGRGPLLVDSGAFSVAHSWITVDIDKYITYINSHSQVENFIELDVIPYPVLNNDTARESAEGSWNNYLYMIDRLDEPFKLLPVFHFGEDLKYLRRILNFEYKGQKIPFMCIGGRHGVSIAKQEKYFETVFREIELSNNPNVKIHVLGMTVLSTLEKFPFYSADSSTHLQFAIYGAIYTRVKDGYGAVNISNGNSRSDNYRYLLEAEQEFIKSEVASLGYTIEQLAESTIDRLCYNIDYVLRWAENYVYKGPKSFKKTGGLF